MAYEKGTEVVLKGTLDEVPQNLRKSVGKHFIIVNMDSTGKYYFVKEKDVESDLNQRIPASLLYSLEDLEAEKVLVVTTADGTSEEFYGWMADHVYNLLNKAMLYREAIVEVEVEEDEMKYTFLVSQVTKIRMYK